MSDQYILLFADLDEEQVLELTRKRIEGGEDPMRILDDTREGMAIVGRRFAEQEYYLPELIYSGELFQACADMVKPVLAATGGAEPRKRGKVVLGTVAGDIHDIGLNVVDFMLDAHGFDVTNLGVNVPVAKFVEVVDRERPAVLGLSGFLTVAFDAMKQTVDSLESAGLRKDLKIMIGGGPVNAEVMKYAGADGFGRDAAAALALATDWIGV